MKASEIFEKIRHTRWRTRNYQVSETDITTFTNTFISPALIGKDKIAHPIMIFGIVNYLTYSLEDVSPAGDTQYAMYDSIMDEFGYRAAGGGDGGHFNLDMVKPVVPGSIIYGELKITGLNQSKSRPDLWIWTRHWTVKEQKDQSIYLKYNQNAIHFYES
jgi:hypothetical protein